MLPEYLQTYLTEQGIPPEAYADPLTSFADLGLDPLDRQSMAALIDEHTTCAEIKDTVYEAWETIADLVEAAVWHEGVVV